MFVEDIYNEEAITKEIYLKYGSYTVDNFDKPQNNNALKFLEPEWQRAALFFCKENR